MGNPLGSWKFLPWRSLALTSGVTLLAATVLDLGILWAAAQSPSTRDILQLVFSSAWGMVIQLCFSFGIGILAIFLLETVFKPGPIYISTLWALVLCLLLSALLVGLLSSILGKPGILIHLDQLLLIGMVLGVFWKGRRYWR
jgi:hypothetical protein